MRRTLGDDVTVFTGNKRGRAEFVDAAESNIRLIAISGSLGGIGLFVAVLVIAGMLSLFVQQRQREVALLRAMGATPRQVRRMIARETLIVTVLGAAVGVWPGLWLATRLADAMQGRGLLPGTFEIDPGGIPVFVAVGTTVLASQISAFLAGRRAGKVRPVEALTTAAAPRLGLAWFAASWLCWRSPAPAPCSSPPRRSAVRSLLPWRSGCLPPPCWRWDCWHLCWSAPAFDCSLRSAGCRVPVGSSPSPVRVRRLGGWRRQ